MSPLTTGSLIKNRDCAGNGICQIQNGVVKMEKKVNTKILLRSGLWYTLSSFLTRAMVFITMPLFTRILTKEQYGDFSVYTNWQASLLIVCGLEAYSTINRARFDFEGKELDSYISSVLVLSSLFTGIVFGLYRIFPNMFDRLFLIDRRYMMIMFAYLFTYPAFAMFHTKQRIEYKYKLSTTIAFVALLLSYILSVFLTFSLESDRLFGRIVGQFSLYIIIGASFYLYFLFRSHLITIKAWKYALRLGLPMVFAYLGSQILLSSDNIVVKHMCSSEEVSYLAIVHSCSHIILLLVQSMNTAWAPWLFDMLKLERMNEIKKTYAVYLWLTIVGTIGVVLLGPELILVLAGRTYFKSLDMLPAYILCGVFTVLTSQFSNLETYHKKPEYSAIFTAIAAVLNVILNIVCVKIWGYEAVCYTTLACQLLLVGLHYHFTNDMRIQEILPARNLFIALAFVLLIIPLALLLYKNNIIRYLFILAIAVAMTVFIVKRRSELKTLLYRIKKL